MYQCLVFLLVVCVLYYLFWSEICFVLFLLLGDPDTVQFLCNTKHKGFEWQSIKSSKKYWNVLTRMTTTGIPTLTPTQKHIERLTKCFEILLQQREIVNILEQPGKAMELLLHLAKYKLSECTEVLVGKINTLGIKIALQNPGDPESASKNPLIKAIHEGQSDIVKILLKSGLFDVNGKDFISNDAPILECIRATTGFERDNQLECDNGLIFTNFLNQPGLDLTVKGKKDNYGVIRLCYLFGKLEFVELILQKIQEISDDNDDMHENSWGLDETTIKNELMTYQTFGDIVKFAQKGDIKSIEILFKEKKDILSDVFPMRDKYDKTIWHHSCSRKDVKLLKLLIDTATKEECKACLNLAAASIKRLPFHYACAGNRPAIVKYFKELSQSDEFGDIVDLDIVDGDNKSGLQLAVDNGYRDIIRILFDETKLNPSQLNRVFSMFVTEYDKSKYDESFCKRLLGIKGISAIDCLRYCLVSNRPELFKYLMQINDKMTKPLTVAQAWANFQTYPHVKMVKYMVTCKIPGLEFKSLGNDTVKMKQLLRICQSQSKSMYKCFAYLIEQDDISKIIKNDARQAKFMIEHLIDGNKFDCIERLYQVSGRFGWNTKEWTGTLTKNPSNTYNALMYAISKGAYESVRVLVKAGGFGVCLFFPSKYFIQINISYLLLLWQYSDLRASLYGFYTNNKNNKIDINCKDKYGITPMLLCCKTQNGYSRRNSSCSNVSIFKFLSLQRGIDLFAVDDCGRNCILVCHMNGKQEFIDYLKEKIKDDEFENDLKLTEEMIDNEIEKYTYLDKMTNVVESGN